MAARPCHPGRRPAADPRPGLSWPVVRRRASGFDDDRGARRLQRQGPAGAGLAAGASVMAPGICGGSEPGYHAACGLSLSQPLLRLAPEPGVDALDHLLIVVPKAVPDDIAEMRRQHHVVELAEGMVDRERIDRKHVDAGAGDL